MFSVSEEKYGNRIVFKSPINLSIDRALLD